MVGHELWNQLFLQHVGPAAAPLLRGCLLWGCVVSALMHTVYLREEPPGLGEAAQPHQCLIPYKMGPALDSGKPGLSQAGGLNLLVQEVAAGVGRQSFCWLPRVSY